MSVMSRLPKFWRSHFLRSALTLSSGQLVAMVFTFALAPILSRLYAPADYGVLGTYSALAVVLSAAATLQMARALVAEAEEARARALLGLSLWLTGSLSLVVLAILWIGLGSGWIVVPELGAWLLLLPVTVFVSGAGAALIGWANRNHRYRLMSAYQVTNAVMTSGGALAFALGGYGAKGLMIGYFLGQFGSFLVILVGNFRLVASLRHLTWAEMRAAGLAQRKYAIWSTPTSIIEQFSGSSPILVLSLWASMLDIVGHYNRARGLLMLPLGLLGSAISQIFFRRAAEDMARHGHCRALFWKLVFAASAVSAVMFSLLGIFAPWLFTFILGPQWEQAGHIARILAPVIALQMVTMPASKVMWLYHRQKLDFFFSVFFASATTLSVASVAFLGFSPDVVIYVFAAVQILNYLAYLIASILIVERDHRARQEQAAVRAPIQS